MTYLLDTNAAIEAMRPPPNLVRTRLSAESPADVVVCSISVGELRFGAGRSANPTVERAKISTLLAQFASLPFDDAAAEEYARIRVHLERVGQRVGLFDAVIAAVALAHDLTVVTHNLRDFGRVPGLRVEDWQVP